MNHKPSFKNVADFRTGIADYDYYNTTGFFRYGWDIRRHVQYFDHFYKDVPFVNVICHACSQGQQPLSLYFMMKKMLGKKADKFHIEGRDFDSMNIRDAIMGSYTVTPAEMQRMIDACGNALYKYIDFFGNSEDSLFIKIKDEVKNKIPFKKVDILKDNDIPSENTILYDTNMWPYLPQKKQIQLGEKLFETLAPSSHLVLDKFDISNHVHELLRKIGFEHTEVFEIMKKPGLEKPEIDDARIMLNKIKAIGKNKICGLV